MKSISIIGAGPAGIEAAAILAAHGMNVSIFEKSESPLSNITDKAFLFPNFADANDFQFFFIGDIYLLNTIIFKPFLNSNSKRSFLNFSFSK